MSSNAIAVSERKWMSIAAAVGLRAGLQNGEAHDSTVTRRKMVG